MSNKTQLQENNIELQGIIDIIQELPEAIPDELGSAITTDVLIGKTFTSDSGIMQQGGLDPETLKTGIYVWKKLTAEGGDFVDFVVNDTETAYPDGGMQEGYWYEKIKGTNGVDYGTVTLSNANTASVNVSHSLGVIPSHTILITIPLASFGSNQTPTNVDGEYYQHGSYVTNAVTALTGGINKTKNSITFMTDNTYPFIQSTYYWFAIA